MQFYKQLLGSSKIRNLLISVIFYAIIKKWKRWIFYSIIWNCNSHSNNFTILFETVIDRVLYKATMLTFKPAYLVFLLSNGYSRQIRKTLVTRTNLCEASHIFSKLAFGESRQVWQVLSKRLCECRQVWRVRLISEKDHFGEYSNSPKMVNFRGVLEFAKFACEWPI